MDPKEIGVDNTWIDLVNHSGLVYLLSGKAERVFLCVEQKTCQIVTED